MANNRAAAKAVITDPKTAAQILRQYLKTATNHVKVRGSQARYASPQSICEWYQQQYGCVLDRGWFFRSLNAAMNNGAKITKVNADGTPLYRFAS